MKKGILYEEGRVRGYGFEKFYLVWVKLSWGGFISNNKGTYDPFLSYKGADKKCLGIWNVIFKLGSAEFAECCCPVVFYGRP